MSGQSVSEASFQRFMKGDLEHFYRYIYPDMLLYAGSLLQGPLAFLAEDCVQNSVEKTYYARDRFATSAQWKGYMMTCIRNQTISMMRTKDVSDKYADYFALTSEESEDILLDYIRQETLTRLYRAIETLPEELREILELSYMEGLKISEISERLGIAEITVKKRKARMIATLRLSVGREALMMLLILHGL